MRILSPQLTIAAAANVSNGIDIGHHRIVGIVPVTAGDMTDAEKIAISVLTSGNLGQGNEVWKVFKRVAADGTVTPVGILGSAWEVANSAFIFSAVDNDGILTNPVVRLALVNATTGAAGTNAASQIVAQLILEPHK